MKPSLPPFVFFRVRGDTFVGWEGNGSFYLFSIFRSLGLLAFLRIVVSRSLLSIPSC